ncbi:spermidine/putrescine ABC transporter substrate-binding protein [Clostridium sp. Sa3CUN1]|uniref:Spermidine/putrescine ABC transporter substrate-binding protein n=1 Tax=Clostridium gallinarum TaxID=2762246 RepID=A0ABR8Q3B8_9CLOT|nr:spermidine/putrescine ABC transporter substrate-binding protein [Clostridium gallinarum]MBD7914913.1 spermidine/putrescine ABC transporter substrate-binding protein [Clostridium gallinarum]
MNKLKRISVLLFSILFTASLFVGCKNNDKKTINVLNYGENIADGLIKEFEEEYNVKVNYKTFDDMETMYIEVASGKTNWDAVLVADYMADRMIQEGLLQKINKDNIPNLSEMSENDMGQPYDPSNEYTVPYMNGTIGIIYNKDLVDDTVDSWDIMWNEKYKKQIFVLDAQRDAIGMALKKLGYSLNTTNEKELEEAKNLLIEQKPLVLKYGADEVKDLMTSGEAAIAMIWSGEGLTLADENENLEYIIPKEGANYWLDSWAIPTNANDKETAEKFINFVSSKDNAYKIAEEIGYTTPNKLAMEEQPEEVRNNEAAYMPEEIMERCEVYQYLPQEKLRLYEDVWSAVKTAD